MDKPHNSFAVYTRTESGLIEYRGVYEGFMSLNDLLAEYGRADYAPEVEQLLGWPHPSVTWYGNLGIGAQVAALPTMTEAEYLAHPADYRGVWTTERTDIENWDQIRDQHIGKRTLMRNGGLEVEGISFRIVG